MNDGIADHLAKTPLTTLALFSVTHTKTGKIDTGQTGYKRITGGHRQAADPRGARPRASAVQLIYTSFGTRAERAILRLGDRSRTRPSPRLVALADEDRRRRHRRRRRADRRRARARLRRVRRSAARGAAGEAARRARCRSPRRPAGPVPRWPPPRRRRRGPHLPDGLRLPLRGLRTSARRRRWTVATAPRPTCPGRSTCTRRSASRPRRRSSACRCTACAGAWRGRRSARRGSATAPSGCPADNPKFLADPPAPPEFDPIEIVDFYSVAPTVSPVPGDSRATAGWQAIYVDSPDTLRPKLALADERGLAGAGFWAIGYERGLPGYRELMTDFTAGKVE